MEKYIYGIVLIVVVLNGKVLIAEDSPSKNSYTYSHLPNKEFMKRWLICGAFPVDPTSATNTISTRSTSVDDNSTTIFQVFENQLISKNNTLQQLRTFDSDLLSEHGGESDMRPQEGMTHHYYDSEYTWQVYQSNENIIDFQSIYGSLEFMIAYAYAEIEMPQKQQAHIYLGSDDAAKV